MFAKSMDSFFGMSCRKGVWKFGTPCALYSARLESMSERHVILYYAILHCGEASPGQRFFMPFSGALWSEDW